MDEYRFDDALTGSSVSCGYPGLEALMVREHHEVGECESLFFPGCSFLNYGLPLVQSVNTLLVDAGIVDGVSLLCCGKILEYEPNGKVARANFEVQLRDAICKAKVKRIVAACPNCVKALREAFADDERTKDVEVVPLPVALGELGYKIDSGVARRMLATALDEASYEAGEPGDVNELKFTIHDSCPDRDTGEFAEGLRSMLPEDLFNESEHNRKKSFCCGSLVRAKGLFEAADKQARRHGEEALAVSAKGIITVCVSCAYQMTMAQHSTPVFHYLELLYDWRIPWYFADQYMKLRFLFDENLGVTEEEKSGRSFVGLDGGNQVRADLGV